MVGVLLSTVLTERDLLRLRPHVDEDVTRVLVWSIATLLATATWARARAALTARAAEAERLRR